MIITENFDTDNAKNWQVFSGTSLLTVQNSKLRYKNDASHGAVIAPYELSGLFDLCTDITLIADTGGYKEAGLYLFNADKTNWIYFVNLKVTTFGYEFLVNSTPKYPIFNGVYTQQFSDSLDIGGTINIRLKSADCRNVEIYRNGVLFKTIDLGWVATGFALHNYGTTLDFDNLKIESRFKAVTGNSKQDDGKVSRFVLINDWETGNFIEKIKPNASGDWVYMAKDLKPVLVTQVGQDGFKPQSDGGVIPVVV